ncbi:peptidoglycan recognition protein 1-like [Cephus cinctus]|uniref:Peptidoglycan recognition protein 1-like n=1 Tax=Cephus cinctus TaxID=211228 RepID=A0AAJ7C9B5_CEPCN|nr:peptidoglycan recognition protein 1-like [Cephus cinctus]
MFNNIRSPCFLNSCKTTPNTSSTDKKGCHRYWPFVWLTTFIFGVCVVCIWLVIRKIHNDAEEVKIIDTTTKSFEYYTSVKNTEDSWNIENITVETEVTSNRKIYTREDWGARESLANDTEYLTHPIRLVVIGHTAGRYCESHDNCSYIVCAIQNWQVGSLAFVDIGYNFLVGGDGGIYEGVGWNITNSLSKNCLFVTFIGNYIYDELKKQQEEALMDLLEYTVNIGYMDINYKLVGHNQVKSTLSPGKNVINFIKNLNNYYAENIILL